MDSPGWEELAARVGVDLDALLGAAAELGVDLADGPPTRTPRVALSVAEVAESLGTSPDLIRSLIRRGELRACRVGRRVLIPSTELSRLIECGDAA